MFSPSRLLGGMVSRRIGSMGRGAVRSATGGGFGTVATVAGVAAAGGVAYAAYRHFQGRQTGGGGAPPGGQAAGGAPAGGFGVAPQAAAAAGFGGGGAAPTGNPFGGGGAAPAANPFGGGEAAPAANPFGGGGAAPPENPFGGGGAGPAARAEEEQALVLVRAMVAAANVDGHIDPQERQQILQHLAEGGASEADRRGLEAELDAPRLPAELIGAVAGDREMSRQLYLVSLLAIDADTELERAYLAALPPILGLTPEEVAAVHAQLRQ